ncbi:hypothetical protein SAMN04488117_1262 [Celeribacter baekdonensis]|uniref:Uncharacterized protein n=1 Tax=Celeribacter baekdonensis TaxID=875171 RepID=A0A1G7USZ8_9RHOB|nr:hypothetical protein SAMN04488117_1262 [Celeribacter baekdonensis]
MVWNAIVQIETAEPAISQVQMHFLTEPSFRPDAETVSDQQHPDQQLGIDGGTAGVAVEIRQMGTDAAQVDKPVDRSQQVVLRDMILKRELVEKCCLCFLSRPHHRQTLPPVRRIESATYASIKHEFFNKIRPI